MDGRLDPENPLSVVHKLARAIRVTKRVAAVSVGVGLGTVFSGLAVAGIALYRLGLVEFALGLVLWVFVANKLTVVRSDTVRYAEELRVSEQAAE